MFQRKIPEKERGDKKNYRLFFFLIISTGVLVYSNSLGNAFLWDDVDFIIHNDLIKDIKFIPLYFTSSSALAKGTLGAENYRPFVPLTYSIDYFFWKLNPFGYHLTNLIFHIANAVLVFYFVLLITGNGFTSLFASLFFLTHPVQTESVTWISGRGNVLFLFFYLASLIAYINYAKKNRLILYFVSLLFFASSLLSREMAASLPLILILYDVFYGKKEKISSRAIRYFPYFLMLEGYVILRFGIIGKLAQTGFWTGSAYTTMLTMAKGVIYYVKLLIYPVNLCADYLTFPISRSIKEPSVLFSFLAIILLLTAALMLAKKFRHLSFSVFWFFITLLPVSNIIPIKILIAERFLYLPSIGYCIIVSVFLMSLCVKFKKEVFLYYSIFSAGIFLVITYSYLTMERNNDWSDTVTWAKKILARFPNNARIRQNLAVAYAENGEAEKAYSEAVKTLEISPDFPFPRLQVAGYYVQKNKLEEAEYELKTIEKLNPDFIWAYLALGSVYVLQKKYDLAYKEYTKALIKDPCFVEAKLYIAGLYSAKGDNDLAIEEYEKILKENLPFHYRSHYAAAYLRLGSLYAFLGNKEKAVRTYRNVYEDFKDQIWFYEISTFLVGEVGVDEVLRKTEPWQAEFKIILYYYVGVKNELDGKFEEALIYYAKACNMPAEPLNAIKLLAAERLKKIEEKHSKGK